MIIDIILDRKCGEKYSPREFYRSIMEYGEMWPGIAWPIARAMDGGTEKDVKRELCEYIDNNGYNPEIKEYINSVNWL